MITGVKRLALAALASLALFGGVAEANVSTVPGNSYREYPGCDQVTVNSIKQSTDSALFVDRQVQFYLIGTTYALTVSSRVGTHDVVYNVLPATGIFTVNNQDPGDVLVDKTCP